MQTSDHNLKNTILAINDRWNIAFNAGRADEVTALYAEGASIAPAGSPQISEREGIHNFWQGLIDNGVSEHRIDCIEVSQTGALAYQRGLWGATATASDGNKQTFSGNLVVIYQRQQDGSLKALVHIWN
jgi:ketosteroid isomerase-like protein